MGSGREGSPSPIGEGKVQKLRKKSGGITTSMSHMSEREQLLGLHENNSKEKHNNQIGPDLANVVPGATLSCSSASSLSPHRVISPKSTAQVFPLNASDLPQQQLQEDVQGHPKRSPKMDNRDDKDGSEMGKGRSSPDMLEGKGRSSPDMLEGKEGSPLNSRRLKANLEEEVIAKDMKSPSIIHKGRVPRRTRNEFAEEIALQQPIEKPNGRPFSRPGRSTGRSRMEIVETEGCDLVEPGSTTRLRNHSSQPKRKAPESIAPIPQISPEPIDPHPIAPIPQLISEPIDPHPIPSIPQIVSESIEPLPVISEKTSFQISEPPRHSSPSSRRARRECRDSPEGSDWLQYMVDTIMWQDTSKSALLFGFGSFCVLSSFFMQDLHFSLVSILSYLALGYLAAVFFYKSILCRGAIDQISNPENYGLSEAHALSILRFVLPAINELIAQFRELFSGDPATTMKLASALWLLAQCGHMMTIWTLARLAFFAIFTIPKLYACYSAQLHGYGRFMLHRFWDAWNACSHKKGVLAAVCIVAWNLSTVAARVWGAFILIVALRLYQQSLRRDQDNQNVVAPEGDIQMPAVAHGRETTGLELITIPQPVC